MGSILTWFDLRKTRNKGSRETRSERERARARAQERLDEATRELEAARSAFFSAKKGGVDTEIARADANLRASVKKHTKAQKALDAI